MTISQQHCRVRPCLPPLRYFEMRQTAGVQPPGPEDPMDANWPQTDSIRAMDRVTRGPEGGHVGHLPETELDRRIRVGWEEWCDLLDNLLGTGGVLPSRELAGRVVAFFEDAYWRAEEARIEALRRQLSAERAWQASHAGRGIT